MDFNLYLDVIRNHYLDFEGVADRRQFWTFVAFNILIAIGLGIVGWITRLHFIHVLYALGIFLPHLGLNVRRMHDVGMSGWFLLVGLIPILGWLVLLYFFLQPSKTPYGAAPIV